MSSRKESEEPLKALVFGDACGAECSTNLSKGKSLLNIPILTWQLSTLARFGVKEAIVLSSNPIEDLYKDRFERMKITNISSPAWNGEGDAIRDVESRDGVRPADDFVLVRQGTIFNVNITELVAQHKKRRDTDRNWLLTTVLRRGAGSSSTGLVVAVDAATGTLIKFADNMQDEGVNIDVNGENSGLRAGGRVEICTDVLDVGLDVCAPDFLLEFRENFYYDNVRAYVKEKLEGGEAEVFGNRMYAHYLDSKGGQYATRISSLASLMQASLDVLNGCLSPITQSSVLGVMVRELEYDYHSEFTVERSAVGEAWNIHVGATIIDSVIGDNVRIGNDATIVQSIIGDGVVIADRAGIERSIIDENATVLEDCTIPRNCFLGQGVKLGVGCQLGAGHLFLTRDEQKTFESDEENFEESEEESEEKPAEADGKDEQQTNGENEESNEEWDVDIVGDDGEGHLIDARVAAKIDRFFVKRKFYEETFESDEPDELEEDDVGDVPEGDANGDAANGEVHSLTKGLEDANINDEFVDDEDVRFAKFNEEVLETIERAEEENIDVDNTILEVNSLKLVYHCTFAEILAGVISGLGKTIEKNTAGAAIPYNAVVTALTKYEPLISKFHVEHATHHAQLAAGIARELCANATLLMYMFKAMYDADVLEEGGILSWAEEEKKEVEKGKSGALIESMGDFLSWLEASDEESSDEDK